jgi:hypothetical protein
MVYKCFKKKMKNINNNTNSNNNSNDNFHLKNFCKCCFFSNCFFSIKVQNSFYNIILKILEKPIILNISIFFIFYLVIISSFFTVDAYSPLITETEPNRPHYFDELLEVRPHFFDRKDKGYDFFFKEIASGQKEVLRAVILSNFDFQKMLFKEKWTLKDHEEFIDLIREISYKFTSNSKFLKMNKQQCYSLIHECSRDDLACLFAKYTLRKEEFLILSLFDNDYMWHKVKVYAADNNLTIDESLINQYETLINEGITYQIKSDIGTLRFEKLNDFFIKIVHNENKSEWIRKCYAQYLEEGRLKDSKLKELELKLKQVGIDIDNLKNE